MRTQQAKEDELIIQAGHQSTEYWKDLWRYRELFWFLAWRDVLVRYKQTAIGIAWAVLRPFLTMIVFTVIFGKLAGLPSGGVPYPILVFAAMLPWQFFASALTDCSNSLILDADLISKVYFPRLIVPGRAVIVSAVDLCFSSVILVALLLWYEVLPDWRILAVPFFIGIAAALAAGTGLWFAALTVEYRDFRHILPFALQLGLYVSPVGFSSAVIPEQWRLLYSVNPMVGVIDGIRWAILRGEPALYVPGLLLSIAVVALLLISGLWYFRRMERRFADVI